MTGASVLVGFVLLIFEANVIVGRRLGQLVAIRAAGARFKSAAVRVGFTVGAALRLVVLEILAMFLAVFDTAGAAVPRAIFLTSLVIFFVLQVETIGTESLANDPTAIVVGSVLVVLAARSSYTLRIVCDTVIARFTADLTARVFVPRLAAIRGSSAGNLRCVPGFTRERFAVASPAVMSTLAIGTGALAGRTFAWRRTAFVLAPSFACIRSSLACHFGNESSLTSERLAVAGPAVLSTLTIGTGTLVSCTVRKCAGTTCVFLPRFLLPSCGLASHLWAESARAGKGLAIASPAVMITVGTGTGTSVRCASCVIVAVRSLLWRAEIVESGKLGI